jgi:hypothetical protein
LEARHPLIVIGDFNATQNSRVYKDLKIGGLRSAHEDRGRGYVTTWPNGWSLIPPIRIDQAFLSADVTCQDITEGIGTGSDHKPLILDVQIVAQSDRKLGKDLPGNGGRELREAFGTGCQHNRLGGAFCTATGPFGDRKFLIDKLLRLFTAQLSKAVFQLPPAGYP